jgi:hypothetical protein
MEPHNLRKALKASKAYLLRPTHVNRLHTFVDENIKNALAFKLNQIWSGADIRRVYDSPEGDDRFIQDLTMFLATSTWTDHDITLCQMMLYVNKTTEAEVTFNDDTALRVLEGTSTSGAIAAAATPTAASSSASTPSLSTTQHSPSLSAAVWRCL